MAQISVKQAAGFLITGAMVGAAVALLYAPQSGARTKRDLRKFARNTSDHLDDLQADIRDQVTDWVENITDVVQNGIDQGRKLSSQGYEKVLTRISHKLVGRAFLSRKRDGESSRCRTWKIFEEKRAAAAGFGDIFGRRQPM